MENDLQKALRDGAFYPEANDADSEFAIIVCHYNWIGYKRPVSNMLRFLRQMDKLNISVYGIELYMEGTEPVMKKNSRWNCIKANPKNLMWQKEALLNKAEKMVPKHIKYIGVFDPDIYFQNTNWLEQSLEKLKEFKVIQPFSEGIKLDNMGNINIIKGSVGKYGFDNINTKYKNNTPGLAWIFRREFFDKVGLYPWAIIGSGDGVIAAGLFKIKDSIPAITAIGSHNMNKSMVVDWFKKAEDFMEDSTIGYVEGQIWHEWHGDIKNRYYSYRRNVMNYIDITKHIRYDNNTLLEWTEEVPNELKETLKKYFIARQEDGKYVYKN
jgi:hypothetical protein